MELKQRKKINNIPKFNGGIDSKVGFGQQYQANDLTNMIGGNAPTGSAIAGVGSSNASFNIGQKPFSKWNPKGGIQSAGGALSNVNAGTVTGAVNGTLGIISGFNQQQAAVKDQSGLFGMSGQRTDQAFGVNYQAQNDINKSQAMADISASNTTNTLAMTGSGAAAGAAVGTAIVPGIGSLIGGAAGAIVGLFGGLFGGKKAREKQRRKIFNAQQNANLINQVNQSSAATEGLTQQYYLNNGNTYDDVLYANRGKDLIKPRYVKRK